MCSPCCPGLCPPSYPPCCCPSSCPPNTSFPFAQVCMLSPPACPAPLAPQYVKPLQLPCECPPPRDKEKDFETRYANFYNYYNENWHPKGKCTPSCPTGFKICTMTLTPPPGCHPLGTWKAKIQACPPKFFRENNECPCSN